MKEMPDAVVSITLLPAGQGGWHGPISAASFGCVLQTDGRSYDVRLRLPSAFMPGSTQQVGVDFLFRDDALSAISAGTRFRLWEGRVIGSGHVLPMATAEHG